MSAERIARDIAAVEAEIPQDLFARWGIDWWPIVRLDLYMSLWAGEFAPATAVARSRFRTAFRTLAPLVKGIVSAIRQPRTPRTGDLWLISDGVSYQCTGGKLIERFCGPLSMGAEQAKLQPFAADAHRTDTADLMMPPLLLGHEVRLARLAGGIIALARRAPVWQEAFDRLEKVVRTHCHDNVSVSASRVTAQIEAVRLLSMQLERRWRAARPAAVVKVGYYDLAGFACMLAARRLGICSADIQHGVAGELHAAYGRWGRVPPEGYALLPSHFLCWSKADATAIEAWAATSGGRHRAIVCGIPMVEAWRAGWLPDREAALTEINQRRESSQCAKHVLVTLQPGLTTPEQLEVLLSAAASVPDCFWWIRLHPAALDHRDAIDLLMHSVAPGRYDIDRATALPLNALLEQCDIHATHSSSTVIEACAFGCPSVLWSPAGAELFASAVRSGEAITGFDTQSFSRAIACAADVRRTSKSPTCQLTDALHELTAGHPPLAPATIRV